MYLRYYLDQSGKRIYTLKVVLDDGSYTFSAHPARFSPDDKFSKERLQCKQRFGLLMTQRSEESDVLYGSFIFSYYTIQDQGRVNKDIFYGLFFEC